MSMDIMDLKALARELKIESGDYEEVQGEIKIEFDGPEEMVEEAEKELLDAIAEIMNDYKHLTWRIL